MTTPGDEPRPESLWESQRKMMGDMLQQWAAFASPARPPTGTDFTEQMRAFFGNAAAVA